MNTGAGVCDLESQGPPGRDARSTGEQRKAGRVGLLRGRTLLRPTQHRRGSGAAARRRGGRVPGAGLGRGAVRNVQRTGTAPEANAEPPGREPNRTLSPEGANSRSAQEEMPGVSSRRRNVNQSQRDAGGHDVGRRGGKQRAVPWKVKHTVALPVFAHERREHVRTRTDSRRSFAGHGLLRSVAPGRAALGTRLLANVAGQPFSPRCRVRSPTACVSRGCICVTFWQRPSSGDSRLRVAWGAGEGTVREKGVLHPDRVVAHACPRQASAC